MDAFVPTFMRVQRGLTKCDHVMALLERLETADAHRECSGQDRLAVLDMPDETSRAKNVAIVTALSTQELAKRATHSPAELTSEEIALLKKRYWADESDDERQILMEAERSLMGVSQDHFCAIVAQLEEVRAPLYDQDEGNAIQKAWDEDERQWKAERREEKHGEVQQTLASENCPDWAKRWINETNAIEPWGFARYIEPEAAQSYGLEEYLSTSDAQILKSGMRLGFHPAMGSALELQDLDWPINKPLPFDSNTKKPSAEYSRQDSDREKNSRATKE